jgi:hypothetical protein
VLDEALAARDRGAARAPLRAAREPVDVRSGNSPLVGLLILYHAGLLWESVLALVVAAFHHAFVWVAYFSSEKPDMREIYGTPK